MLWRKPKVFQDPDLGNLTHRDKPYSHWVSDAITVPAGRVLLNVPGDSVAPSVAGLFLAKQAIAQSAALFVTATTHVQSDASARAFIDGQGDLVLDGFSFTEIPGNFTVELALSGWPDAMVNVSFKGGAPCAVELAD